MISLFEIISKRKSTSAYCDIYILQLSSLANNILVRECRNVNPKCSRW